MPASELPFAPGDVHGTVFLEGPAGSGKTTLAVQRLLHLLEAGVPANSILVWVPQRTLGTPYLEALHQGRSRAGGTVTVLTAGGLARRTVELFWPLVGEAAGFAHPDQPPTFLTLETAQYYMARLVRPLLEEEGHFESVHLSRNRLYSQIIDNLNKAAVVGFPYSEIGARLQAAWTGEPAQARVYADAQHCASLFREYCLAHNLLDFSLQVEVFRRHLWPQALVRDHLQSQYRHVVADNLEEETPFAHDLLRDWLPHLESALLVYDRQAGYRQFLGADPEGAYELRELCRQRAVLEESHVTPPALQVLGSHVARALKQPLPLPLADVEAGDVRRALVYQRHRYYPEMLDWVAQEIAGLVEQGVPPGEIVVLSPFLSDALRYSLMSRLERLDVPVRSHRPSRALRDEPATQALLALAKLAHRDWGMQPARFDFTHALLQAIADLDLVRAQLLGNIVFRARDGDLALTSFEQINPDMHERITYVLGGRFDTLRVWLADYQRRKPQPFDHFLGRLFGEVLSQPGFGFHVDYDAAAVTANLVESVQKFRWAVSQEGTLSDGKPLGQEYLEMVEDGVIAAQYVQRWEAGGRGRADAVLLAPAYTFLMGNRPVDYQFWLDLGSRGWYERLYQPLTHPYVLSRHWQVGHAWSTADELAASQQRLAHLVLGLIRRCRRQIYLGLSELGERGEEEHRGLLLWSLNRALRQLAQDDKMASPVDDPGQEADENDDA